MLRPSYPALSHVTETGINLTRNPLSAWNPGFLPHVVENLPPSVDGLFSETHVGVEFVDARNVPWSYLIITTREQRSIQV